MNPIVKNILGLLAGVVVGSIVNMALILLSPYIIPAPSGADITTEEGLKATIHLFKPINFIMPFLAHAIGTLAGAFITAFIAANHKIYLAMAIGVIFLIGGLQMVFMLPSPMWFNALDLIGAYIPMAYLGLKLANKAQKIK